MRGERLGDRPLDDEGDWHRICRGDERLPEDRGVKGLERGV